MPTTLPRTRINLPQKLGFDSSSGKMIRSRRVGKEPEVCPSCKIIRRWRLVRKPAVCEICGSGNLSKPQNLKSGSSGSKAAEGGNSSSEGKESSPTKKVMSYEEAMEFVMNYEEIPDPPTRYPEFIGIDGDVADDATIEQYILPLTESEGFDIDVYSSGDGAYLIPITDFKDDSEIHENLIAMAKLALEKFTEMEEFEGVPYTFKEIERVNYYLCTGAVYYITFQAEAADSTDGINTFQAKVWDNPFQKFKEVFLVKIKAC